jgi:hypothetical protein
MGGVRCLQSSVFVYDLDGMEKVSLWQLIGKLILHRENNAALPSCWPAPL